MNEGWELDSQLNGCYPWIFQYCENQNRNGGLVTGLQTCERKNEEQEEKEEKDR